MNKNEIYVVYETNGIVCHIDTGIASEIIGLASTKDIVKQMLDKWITENYIHEETYYVDEDTESLVLITIDNKDTILDIVMKHHNISLQFSDKEDDSFYWQICYTKLQIDNL